MAKTLAQHKADWKASGLTWADWVRSPSDEVAVLEGCVPDPQSAQRVRNFFEKLLCLGGDYAGKPFLLMDWEWNFIKALFGWKRSNGLLRFEEAALWIAKKNGKTQLGAGLVIHGICRKQKNRRVYGAACDRQQASLVYDESANMVRNSPALSQRLEVVESRRRIINHDYGSRYEVLSKDSKTSGHGINPSLVVIDELHVVDRKLYNTLRYGDLAREQSLTVTLSTAGDDKESIGYERYQYAKDVQKGDIEDTAFLPVIYEAESNDKSSDKKQWYAANPSLQRPQSPQLPYTIRLDKFEKRFQAAKLSSPETFYNFCQLMLNIWQDNIFAWMDTELWEKCKADISAEDFRDYECHMGLDLASKVDLTSLVRVYHVDDTYYAFSSFWAPEDVDKLRTQRGKHALTPWMRQGYIQPTPGNAVDYGEIEAAIKSHLMSSRVGGIAADPWNAGPVIQELQTYSAQASIVEFHQTIQNYTLPMKELYKLVISGKLKHDGNPVMRWQIGNLVARKDSNDNIRPCRDKSKDSIDGPCSLMMALGMALNGESKASVYEERGLIEI